MDMPGEGAFKGDPAIPHANEGTFQAFMGGCWGFVAIHHLKSFVEARKVFTPDYCLALAEEKARKNALKAGKPYKSIQQAREEKDWKHGQHMKKW
eukprot:CAMPEP_0114233374 /NCGR_PEP_ID=MMETSP0058-20121206/5129_1 /TAXON_ID=36894 /ORGANISM="Pyramimonas parkeae, CCMP726" /LENGTH=94 /DNA_ID=CAMNT_0001344957 /DNA_START=118 /DNA_END=399 /DNA_ORIENTATION=+